MSDPITQLKEKVAKTQALLDDLQKFIQESSQSEAASKIREIENHLDAVKKGLRSEFGWLAPKIEED